MLTFLRCTGRGEDLRRLSRFCLSILDARTILTLFQCEIACRELFTAVSEIENEIRESKDLLRWYCFVAVLKAKQITDLVAAREEQNQFLPLHNSWISSIVLLLHRVDGMQVEGGHDLESGVAGLRKAHHAEQT